MTPRARQTLAGAPAVLSLLGGAMLAAWLWTRSPADRSGWYPGTADAAFDAGDYRTAAVCYGRVLQAHPTDAAVAFDLARCLEATGQPDAARGLLLRLAPPNAPGLPQAHLLLVKHALSADRPSAADVAEAQRHLTPVLRDQPDDAEANYWLAVLSAAAGQWDAVQAPAAKAGLLRDVLAKRLNRLAAAQGNTQAAQVWSTGP